jgi:hypothetical protein
MGGEAGAESRADFAARLVRERALVKQIVETTGITF